MQISETTHAEPQDQVDAPVYRVNFWQQPRPGYAWNLDAFLLSEVDGVVEALRWAEEHANGRSFELFVESHWEPVGPFEAPRKAGLIRLCGEDPNANRQTIPFSAPLR